MARLPVVRNRWVGRLVFALLVILFVLLSLFPERYRAAVTLTPTDSQSIGLSGALGQLGAINSVFGNQAAVEVALKVGRSVYVRETVAQQTNLMRRKDFENPTAMHRWLENEVTVRSLRGGIIMFEMTNRDAKLAQDLMGAYAEATRSRLAEISRRQTEYKRDVLVKLVGEASDRLARAQSAYDSFRLSAGYVEPGQSIYAASQRVPALQVAIKGKEVEINAARQFYTDENVKIRQLMAERQALVQQLAQAEATSPAQGQSVGEYVRTSTRAERLLRELNVAKGLYESYMRFLEGTSVEDLTATSSVRILEAPFVDTDRQIDYRFLAAAILVALLWAAVEFYRLGPPAGDRIIVRESHA